MASPNYTADFSPMLWEEKEEEDVDGLLLNYINTNIVQHNQLSEASSSLDDDAAAQVLDVLTLPELPMDSVELGAEMGCYEQLELAAASDDDGAFSPGSILHNSDVQLSSNNMDFLPLANIVAGVEGASASSPPNKQDATTMEDEVSAPNLHSFGEGESSSKSSERIPSPQEYIRARPRSEHTSFPCKRATSHRRSTVDHPHTGDQLSTPLPSCKRASTPHNAGHSLPHPCHVSKTIPINMDRCMSSNNLNFESLILTHKRRKLNISSISKKPSSSSEEDHLLEDTSIDSNARKWRKPSKNLDYERQRRQKINENLYALRSLVPKISKMDKASIVSDAIAYVQTLQKQVEEVNEEIQVLKSWESIINKNVWGSATPTSSKKQVQNKILEVNVTKVEKTIYQLEIICCTGQGVIVGLTKAIEILGLNILNANLIKIDDHILNTIFVEASNELEIEPREFKDMLLRVALMFGLGLKY